MIVHAISNSTKAMKNWLDKTESRYIEIKKTNFEEKYNANQFSLLNVCCDAPILLVVYWLF